MDAQPETAALTEEKKTINWWAFLFWPFVILLLYVLSEGPVLMMVHQRKVPPTRFVVWFYDPIRWAYGEPPFHKALGCYFHLWAPNKFDEHGNER
jgi:hypothetical protein